MAIANIVVADATTPTPVNHTFVPIVDGNDARYTNDAGAQTLAGQESIGFSVKRAADSKSPNTVRQTMYDPVEVAGADGTYTVSHAGSVQTVFTFAQKMTEQERLSLITMHIAALTVMKVATSKLQPQL